MRVVALIAVLASATAAHADGSRESRYGPSPDRAPVAANDRAAGYTGQAYAGRTLGWSGKREAVEASAQTASQVQPWWARGAVQPQQPTSAPYAPQAPIAPAARALPQSLYDTPPPAPVPMSAPVAQAAPQPQQQAAAWRPGQIGVRTYSVGRQFGMSPDPIPAAGPPRMVLIAPPASAPDDEDKPRDDGEWSAKPEKDGQ